MPYKLEKEPGGWRVIDDKGRYYSKKPISKKQATLQQRALYASEGQKLKGRALANGVVPVYVGGRLYLVGDGWLADAWSAVKRNAKKAVSAIATPILSGISRISTPLLRKDYPPKARATLAKYGNGQVYALMLQRQPIQGWIDKALNFVSMGKWEEAKQKIGYDRLFHLSLVAYLNMPTGDQATVKIEKNEVINITDDFKKPEADVGAEAGKSGGSGNAETLRVPVPCCFTLQEMMDRTAQMVGESFYRYDAFTNNCQIFLNNILTANGLNTPQINAWVMQPTDQLLSELPSYVRPFARTITNVAGLADLALEGQGAPQFITGASRVPIRPAFRKQLKQAGISPEDYLAVARDRADEAGYDSRALQFSDEDDSKLMIYDDEGKPRRFGRVGYGDFIIWSAKEALGKAPPGEAFKKQNVYHRSHSKIRGDWRKDKFSPNMLSLKINW